MAARLGMLGTFVVLFIILEVYTYFGLKSIFKSDQSIKVFTLVYLLQSAFVLFALYQVYSGLTQGEVFRSTKVNFMIGVVFTVFVTKFVFGGLMLLQDIGRLLTYIVQFFSDLIGQQSEDGVSYPSRRKVLGTIAAGIASVPFFSMLYGITKGKYNYQVKKVKLAFKDLPPAFDGFKIVQISDIHAGSLDSQKEVEDAVMLINGLDPDAICFTGDLVNEMKDEINPFIDIFAKLKAKNGKYAVLGNHDYYGVPRDGSQDAYWDDFYAKFKTMGFDLLNNEHRTLSKDGAEITLAGVENWGAGRWFPKKGDLSKAVEGLAEEAFTVLMSHDPTHWEEHVTKHQKKIHLTMSGHTHGMQFGLNLPGFKWSPAQYRYKHWIGLHENSGEYLYVNPGFGFLGFPGRVGIWPEITEITLKSV